MFEKREGEEWENEDDGDMEQPLEGLELWGKERHV